MVDKNKNDIQTKTSKKTQDYQFPKYVKITKYSNA